MTLNVPRYQEAQAPQLFSAKPIALTTLGTAAAAVFTAGEYDFLIRRLYVGNRSASAGTYTLHVVDDGGTASAANALAWLTAIGASAAPTLVLQDFLLSAGQSLQASADAADKVQVWGVGAEYEGGPFPW